MKISGIYKITNNLNLHFYVGRSTNVNRRLKQHIWDLRANRHHNPKLQNSFNKYGETNFCFSILCEADSNSLIELEQLAIDEGLLTGRCFNINTDAEYGGVAGRVWTDEQIANIKKGQESSEKFAKTSFKNQSEEDRRRAITLAHSPESRAKAVITRKLNGYSCSKAFKEMAELRSKESIERVLRAIDWVIDTKETMTVANKKFRISQKMWKKVIPLWEERTGKKFDLPMKASGKKNARFNGGLMSPLGEFESAKHASKETGIPYSTIIWWCKNGINGWHYKKDQE